MSDKKSIDTQQIHKIAALAMLEIDPANSDAMAQSMSAILQMVDAMNRVDTSAIEPMAHPFDACLRLRDDVVTEGNQRELWQQNAPSVADGFFLVPKVID